MNDTKYHQIKVLSAFSFQILFERLILKKKIRALKLFCQVIYLIVIANRCKKRLIKTTEDGVDMM
jgi:hypothetical protein